MNILNFIPIGSYTKGTYIPEYSDLDYLIVFSKDDFHKGFDKIVTYLQVHFSIIRIDPPAISIKFNNKNIDLIPCFHERNMITRYGELKEFIIYGKNGLERTCPSLHDNFLWIKDKQFNKELLPFIVKTKQWKYKYNINISSFRLEQLSIIYFNKTNKDRTIDNFVSIINKINGI